MPPTGPPTRRIRPGEPLAAMSPAFSTPMRVVPKNGLFWPQWTNYFLMAKLGQWQATRGTSSVASSRRES